MIVAVCLCLAVAGCGSPGTAASPTKTPTKKVAAKVAVPTPVPTAATAELKNYALLVQPVVHSGIMQITTLLTAMKNTSVSQLGRTCVTAGGDLASNRDAFTTITAPPAAKKVRGSANHGYSITLGATDECGIAADSNSSSAMVTAGRDMQNGLRELVAVQTTLAGWAAKH